MSVYVDRLTLWPVGAAGGWRFGSSCHMTADTFAELHEMADKIGLKRGWFQNHPRYPHYDLTDGKRKQAIAAGAIEQRRPVKARRDRLQ